jgi:hypothetical protein
LTTAATSTSAATANPAATVKMTSIAWASRSVCAGPVWGASGLETVTSTASPSAAPTCWTNLTSPDAAPASLVGTPASEAAVSVTSEAVVSVMSEVPAPPHICTRLASTCSYGVVGLMPVNRAG